LIAVDRAIADLRRGSAIVVRDQQHLVLMLASEGVGAESLAAFESNTRSTASLAITGPRAKVLGFSQDRSASLLVRYPGGLSADEIEYLSDPTSCLDSIELGKFHISQAGKIESACLLLTKLARLLPAAVLVGIDSPPENVLVVDASQIESYKTDSARSLRIVSRARVPLDDIENASLVAFRPTDGGIEHFAIVVGDPDLAHPVLVRLHSECFTGDLLGSMRCDCGSQLRGGIQAMAKEGSGVLLYLAQEGRGIGLVNKLRAYQLQDSGYDTVDANLQLGFDEDERVYLPAAQMLKLMGIERVRLMTNNPIKMDALSRYGIEVTERVRHVFAANPHNSGYLQTKATKAGHLI